ncbi:MAG: TolC family protein [Candidatus Eisenbacteria bacterium]|uniref:TolC family protein n=1 Tax=Eiseniibacteriota bacterium TaxID=2212470 RepID=A0A538T1C1_UNCEI|nr:MAG: TolC family protein [Candidatus Eisenbacteria bacterium]
MSFPFVCFVLLITLGFLAGEPAGIAAQEAGIPVGPGAPSPSLDSLLLTPSLDLRLLERAVLARNSTLGAMRASWRAAQAAADQAAAFEDPMVEVSSAPRTWSGSSVDPAYMVEISQRVPIFGQRGLKGRAARASARAIGEDYQSARLDLIRETRRAYYESYFVMRSQGVNAELKNLLGQLRRVALTKYSSGSAGLEDVLQAEMELAMLDQQEIALARQSRVLQAQLNALLQRDPGSPLSNPPQKITEGGVPSRVDSLQQLAKELRPELRGWAAQREARKADLSLARRQRLPDFTFSARYDRYWEAAEVRPSVGVAFNLPIQLGRLRAAEREARAGVEQAEARRQESEARVASEVESALAEVWESWHEIHILQDRVVPSAERVLLAIRASYENNRLDFPALLNAERDVARARLQLDAARVANLQALANLDRAVGVAPAEASQEEK